MARLLAPVYRRLQDPMIQARNQRISHTRGATLLYDPSVEQTARDKPRLTVNVAKTQSVLMEALSSVNSLKKEIVEKVSDIEMSHALEFVAATTWSRYTKPGDCLPCDSTANNNGGRVLIRSDDEDNILFPIDLTDRSDDKDNILFPIDLTDRSDDKDNILFPIDLTDRSDDKDNILFLIDLTDS
ncbi:hypothetical protein RRG08_017784 [Elysia crispata]|uniref:Uncharacterized protein n=1 Tax=Elysia crispata TaxID=231223 RepID=A0AAE1AR51_9GAST|nr:hypothetical protein RRG08_017784 [Elysia crispata]